MGRSPEQVRARLAEIGHPLGIRLDQPEGDRRLSTPAGAHAPVAAGSSTPTGSPPATAEDHFQRGGECRIKEQWDQAITHFTAAIGINPQFADAYFKRGNIKLRLGRHPEAIADYTEAIRLDPKNAKYLNNRGRAYFEVKQYNPAIADFDAALGIDPRFAVSYFNRGLAREATGDRNGAMADFAKSVELEPSNMTYRERLNAANVPRAVPSTTIPVPRHASASPAPSGGIPHPAADADRAAQLNIEYQQALAQWKALPLWKRLRTNRPEPPKAT